MLESMPTTNKPTRPRPEILGEFDRYNSVEIPRLSAELAQFRTMTFDEIVAALNELHAVLDRRMALFLELNTVDYSVVSAINRAVKESEDKP